MRLSFSSFNPTAHPYNPRPRRAEFAGFLLIRHDFGDATDPAKQRIAQDLVRRAVAGEIVTSTQVLAEFAATLLHKLSPAARPADVSAILDALGPIKAIVADGDTVRRAVEAHAQYGVHFYDGMILAAAERGACTRILSEDFNPGQSYFGIKVENPFV